MNLESKNKPKWLSYLALLSLFTFVTNFAYGQSTCQTAVNYTQPINYEYDTIQFSNDSTYWVSFIADSTNVVILTDSTYNKANANIVSVALFDGNCNSPSLLKSSSLIEGTTNFLLYDQLTIGNTYYAKISSSSINSNYTLLLINHLRISAYNWDEDVDCPCTDCNIIKNWKFDIHTNADVTDFCAEKFPFYYGKLCGWKAALGSPQINFSTKEFYHPPSNPVYQPNDDFYYGLVRGQAGYGGEGIRQQVNMKQGVQYRVKFRYSNDWCQSYGITNFKFMLANDSIGNGCYAPCYHEYLPAISGNTQTLFHVFEPNPPAGPMPPITCYDWRYVDTLITLNADYKYLHIFLDFSVTPPSNEPGKTIVLFDSIQITPTVMPVAYVLNNDTTICMGDSLQIKGYANYGGAANPPFGINDFTYEWSPNSVCSDAFSNPTYAAPTQTMWIKFTARNPIGCEAVDSFKVTVTNPIPDFTTNPTSICALNPITFLDNSTCFYGIQAWAWDFGDGTTSNQYNPSHTYTTAGFYTVTMTITDLNGNTYVKTKQVEVVAIPVNIDIIGYRNNCDTIQLFHIDNPESGVSYDWFVKNMGVWIPVGTNNDTLVIDWTNVPIFGSFTDLKVIGTNGSGCLDSNIIRIYKCCLQDPLPDRMYLNNESITSNTIISSPSITNIVVNGELHLYANLSITGVPYVKFGPMAKVILHNGAKLTIDNSTLQAGCYYMWDGIYATDSSMQIEFLNQSEIYSSINGLVSTNGAKIKAHNSSFINNYIGISILDHSKSHPFDPPKPTLEVEVYGCDFNDNMQNPSQPSDYRTLLEPYAGYPSYTGILIENADKVTIGDGTKNPNRFNRLSHGIVAEESNVRIFNNEFVNIINHGSNSASAAASKAFNGAVYAKSNVNIMSLLNQQVIIGGNNGNENEFNNCNIGVFSNGSKTIVSNNTFIDGTTAILFNSFKSDSRIDSNTFREPLYGIKVYKPVQGYQRIMVRENVFKGESSNWSTKTLRPVHLINVNSRASNQSQIANNSIAFYGTRTAKTFGINVENCNLIKINSNIVQRGGIGINQAGIDASSLIGIRISQTMGAQVTDNYLYNLTGIWTHGNLTHTQFSCNEMILGRWGFVFGVNTVLSDQGEAGVWNTQNQWHNTTVPNYAKLMSVTNNILNVDTILWYHNSALGQQFDPEDYIDGVSRLIIQGVDNVAPHFCVGSPNGNGSSTGGGNSSGSGEPTNTGLISLLESPNLTPDERDFLFEEIMMGREYTDLMNEYRAYEAEHLYDLLANDTTLIFLGNTRDVDYKYFVDSIADANYGRFREVLDYINEGEYTSAEEINTYIVPENDIYSNLKTVLAIYLDSWCKGRFDLTEDEYLTLHNIAVQTPYEAGDAVYTARIMIGFDTEENNVPYRLAQQQTIDVEQDISLYPNPASNQLTIELLNVDEDVSGNLSIFSIDGKLVYQASFTTDGLSVELDVSELKNGVYLYKVVPIGAKTYNVNGKLVILKQ
jgi:PKD repeat protein